MGRSTEAVMQRIEEGCLEDRIKRIAEALTWSFIDSETRTVLLEEYKEAMNKRRETLGE